jgi:hypothetical protein
MSDTATIVIAVIGSQIASTGLMLTVLNQRLKDFREVIDGKFATVDEKFKTLDAKLETIRVEIRQVKEQIAKPPLVRP